MTRSRRRDPHEEHPDLLVATDSAADAGGGAIYIRHGDSATILISPDLPRVVREMVEEHEVAHHQIGVVQPPATDATMEKAEHEAGRRAVEQLLPLDELAAFVDARTADGDPVDVHLVAEEFDVADDVARAALSRLLVRHQEAELAERARPERTRCGTCQGLDLDELLAGSTVNRPHPPI